MVAKIDARARLPHEYRIYRVLKGVPVIPRVTCLLHFEDHDAMIMENPGISLPDFLVECGTPFSAMRQAHVAFYASKMISVLSALRSSF